MIQIASDSRAGEQAGMLASATLPLAVRSVRETGLDAQLLRSLLLKAAATTGKTPLPLLAARLHLSISVLRELLTPMLAEQLVDLWNVVFPSDSRVWFDHDDGTLHCRANPEPVGQSEW